MTKLFRTFILLSAILAIGAGCAPRKQDVVQEPQELRVKQLVKEEKNIFLHPKFKFRFEIQQGILAKIDKNGNDVLFVDAAEGTQYAKLIVQPGIPGLALPDNKVEFIKLDGKAGHLYHDTDAKTGAESIDKLIVDMPKSIQTVYMEVPAEFAAHINLKDVIKTWKWQ